MLAQVFATATCLSVRLSVRPSVHLSRAGIVSKFHNSILVFCCQISSQNSKGFPERAPQRRVGVGKFSDFLALSVNISKTVADTAKITISD